MLLQTLLTFIQISALAALESFVLWKSGIGLATFAAFRPTDETGDDLTEWITRCDLR